MQKYKQFAEMDRNEYRNKYKFKSSFRPLQTSKMGLFSEIVNGYKPLNVFAKNLLDIWLDFECACVTNVEISIEVI